MNVFLHCSIWNSVDDSRYCLLFDHGKYRYRCRYHFSNSVPLLCLLNRSSHFEKPTVCFIRFLLCRETRSSLRIRQSVSYSLALPTFLLYRSFVYVLQHVDIRQLPSFNEQDNSRSVSFPLYLYPLLRGYHGEPIIESRDGRRLEELRKLLQGYSGSLLFQNQRFLGRKWMMSNWERIQFWRIWTFRREDSPSSPLQPFLTLVVMILRGCLQKQMVSLP